MTGFTSLRRALGLVGCASLLSLDTVPAQAAKPVPVFATEPDRVRADLHYVLATSLCGHNKIQDHKVVLGG